MRVLLINPSYPFEEFPRLLVTLPYLAAALRSEGHEVEILDLLLARTTPDKIERRMERFRPAGRRHHLGHAEPPHRRGHRGGGAQVRRARPDRDGRPARRPSRSKARSGAFPRSTTSRSARASTRCANWCARSRAAWTCATCADSRASSADTGRVWKNAPRPLEDDLDTLSDPARDLLPLARYLAFDSHASVVTSRGCPYECIFCSAPAWTGRKVRYRDPLLCVDEIEDLARLGFTEITIEDDLFTLYRKHFLAVCGELIDRNTGIRWNAFSRVDTITPGDRRHDGATPAARRSASASRAATRKSSTWSRSTRASPR